MSGKHRIVLLLPIAAAAIWGAMWWHSCGRYVSQGRRDAARDLEKGRLGYEICGHMRGSDGEYAQLLLERYGIHLRPVAFCVVSDEAAGHLDGYNSLMLPEIERRFGADVLERTEDEAEARHNQRIAKVKELQAAAKGKTQ